MEDQSVAHLRHAALLKEYEMNVHLWRHADIIRQSKAQNFLNVNAGLLAFLGGLVALKTTVFVFGCAAISIAVLGAYLCFVWHRSQKRNASYALMHRKQLLLIEKKTKTLSTFENLWTALNNNTEVTFEGKVEPFSEKYATKSSTAMERQLPIAIFVYWWIVLAAGSIALLRPDVLEWILR